MPNSPRAGGVSRKIANHKDRARMREIVNIPNFESVKEAEDFYSDEIISAVRESVNELKEGISDLQKKLKNNQYL